MPFFHAPRQDLCEMGLPFDVADGAGGASGGEAEAELEPSNPAAEAKHVDGT